MKNNRMSNLLLKRRDDNLSFSKNEGMNQTIDRSGLESRLISESDKNSLTSMIQSLQARADGGTHPSSIAWVQRDLDLWIVASILFPLSQVADNEDYLLN